MKDPSLASTIDLMEWFGELPCESAFYRVYYITHRERVRNIGKKTHGCSDVHIYGMYVPGDLITVFYSYITPGLADALQDDNFSMIRMVAPIYPCVEIFACLTYLILCSHI